MHVCKIFELQGMYLYLASIALGPRNSYAIIKKANAIETFPLIVVFYEGVEPYSVNILTY